LLTAQVNIRSNLAGRYPAVWLEFVEWK